MSKLQLYNEKRNFSETTEPTTGEKGKKYSFVVQWHDATRLHYDFRIEIDGVMVSWAVPKGPSLNTNDKRLAIMVEDHPLDYQFFEGTIPAGNYGAGEVRIWDHGTYEFLPEKKETIDTAIKNGNLKFALKGSILKGSFALVKLKNSEKGNEWLMIKHKDEFAIDTLFEPEKLLTTKKASTAFKKASLKPVTKIDLKPIAPMLASLNKGDNTYKDCVFEKKYDGYRCVALINDGVPTLLSRNTKDFTTKFQSITNELKAVNHRAILDGELIYEKDGKENFQSVSDGDSEHIYYMVFDLLHLDGHDLYQFPLTDRQDLLAKFFENISFKKVKISKVYDDQEALLTKSAKENWEGIIAKKKSSLYYPSRRTEEWIKIKNHQSVDMVICGFTAPQGGRSYFGSIVLGMKDHDQWRYYGNCGTGFNDTLLKEIYELLKKDIVTVSPFEEIVKYKLPITWVEPKIICEVKFFEFTNDNRLRHPVFIRLRDDKDIKDVKAKDQLPELPIKEEIIPKKTENKKSTTAKTKSKKSSSLDTIQPTKAIITNPDKIYWPKEKITKGNIIAYYQEIAPYILPYLKDHPLSLNRHPNGITKPSFFQKNMEVAQLPEWVKTVPIHSDSREDVINYLLCNDADSLVYLANLGCIEINAWLSTIHHLENPDFVLIDLDPGEIDFKYVVDVALATRAFLKKFKIEAFCKTSGSTGLHLYIPTAGKYDFDVTKQFAEWVASAVHEQLPEITSVERASKNRKDKIYIDFLQNRTAQTIAVPFSVRPKPGATVSFPLHWEQVNHSLKMSDYTIFNVPDLVKNWDDPWKNLFKKSAIVDISKVLSNI